MSWVKASDDALDDARFLSLSRGARLMHIEALAWNNRTLSDGLITPAALRRLTDEPDPEAAAVELVKGGLWEEADAGWLLVYMLKDQPTREVVEAQRERNREKQARSRRRRELHLGGDHSTCDARFCEELQRNPVTNRETDRVSTPGRNSPPSRPLPTRPPARGGDGEEEEAPAIAAKLPDGSGSAGGVEVRRQVARTIRERSTVAEARRFHRAFRKQFREYTGELRESIHPSVMAIVRRDERDRPMVSATVMAANRLVYGEAPDG